MQLAVPGEEDPLALRGEMDLRRAFYASLFHSLAFLNFCEE